MTINSATIIETTLSDAWLNTVSAVDALPGRSAFHLVTRITRPRDELPTVRVAADELSEQLRYPSVVTVANTIFPEELADTSCDHHELAERYRTMYSTIRHLALANRRGTYFGRIVAYPTSSGQVHDQLNELIQKLRTEIKTRGPKSARYELALDTVGDESQPSTTVNAGGPVRKNDCSLTDVPCATISPLIHAPGRDRAAMGFPCLSFCSFQLDHDQLHLIAHYRRQHLIERGYGNYLGLGRLLRYVSQAAGVDIGQLMVVAGVAVVDAARYRVARLLSQARLDQTVSTTPASSDVGEPA